MKVVLYTTILGKPKSANSSVIVPEVATESLQSETMSFNFLSITISKLSYFLKFSVYFKSWLEFNFKITYW